MPPKKADKVPRRARARARDRRRPQAATGLKIVGASFVVLALGVGWLNAVGRNDADETAVPYEQGGITTVADGAGGRILPSSRAAVPVPFGPNTLVTMDEGLVTTTTTEDGEITTTSLLAATRQPATTWIDRWVAAASAPTPTTRGRGTPATHTPRSTTTTSPSTTTTTRPSTTTSTSTTTTRPTTTSTSTTTTTTGSTTSTTEGSTTTGGPTTAP